MAKLSVVDVAARLGVSVGRIHHRIADGSLAAERIGAIWVIDEEALIPLLIDQPRTGRPLSSRSAWAILARADPAHSGLLPSLTATERARAAGRLSAIVHPPADSSPRARLGNLRAALRNRAQRLTFRVSLRDVRDAADDQRLTISGMRHPSSGIASANIVEGYVRSVDFDSYVDDYLLVASSERDANTYLHVLPTAPSVASPLMVAADLADHLSPRAELRALAILEEIAASTSKGRHRTTESTRTVL